jgi:hypothetical protein
MFFLMRTNIPTHPNINQKGSFVTGPMYSVYRMMITSIIFLQWHPVLNTYTIPSRTFVNGITGGPIISFGFSGGSSSLIHPINHPEYF